VRATLCTRMDSAIFKALRSYFVRISQCLIVKILLDENSIRLISPPLYHESLILIIFSSRFNIRENIPRLFRVLHSLFYGYKLYWIEETFLKLAREIETRFQLKLRSMDGIEKTRIRASPWNFLFRFRSSRRRLYPNRLSAYYPFTIWKHIIGWCRAMTVIGRHDQFAIDWRRISVSHSVVSPRKMKPLRSNILYICIASTPLNIIHNKIKSTHYVEIRNHKQLQISVYLSLINNCAGLLHRAYVKLMKSLLGN